MELYITYTSEISRLKHTNEDLEKQIQNAAKEERKRVDDLEEAFIEQKRLNQTLIIEGEQTRGDLTEKLKESKKERVEIEKRFENDKLEMEQKHKTNLDSSTDDILNTFSSLIAVHKTKNKLNQSE